LPIDDRLLASELVRRACDQQPSFLGAPGEHRASAAMEIDERPGDRIEAPRERDV
jgi:hypothetical protein